MPYSLTILWNERNRFLPAVCAVAFSALLIAVQCGLLLGLLAVASRPIDRTRAHLWVGSREVASIGFSHPIPEAWWERLGSQPEVTLTEPYLFGFATWHKPDGGMELCYVIGTRLEDGSLGALSQLAPETRAALTEPGSVVVDESDLKNLGLKAGLGEAAEVSRTKVRVVGVLQRLRSPAMMPGIFCSVRTARLLLPALQDRTDETMYLLARCRRPEDAPAVVRRLREQHPDMAAFTSAEFSLRTRLHWLTKSKGGIVLGFSALLGLLIGAVVTSQTLYAAIAASLREYALLRALGIPRWRLAGLVMAQSFWIGAGGVVLGLAGTFGVGLLARMMAIDILLPGWILGATAVLTLGMALLSGLAALRSLRLVEPALLLR